MQTNDTSFLQRTVVFAFAALALFLVWYLFNVVFIAVLFGFVSIIFAAFIVIIVFVAVKKLYIRDTLREETDIPGDAS